MIVTYEGNGEFLVCTEETEEDFYDEFFGWPGCRDRDLYVRSQAEFLNISQNSLRVNELYTKPGDLDRSRRADALHGKPEPDVYDFHAAEAACKSAFDEEPQ
tara:strand:+ start:315 stop:620 length:306 start_codon:yes stop_codon:yes gene_type:complete